MSPQQSPGKVLIVGAGLAGLMLAQFLRKEGIPFEIFERDDYVDSRQGGWAISLIEALPILARLLPEDVQEVERASVNYGSDALDTMLTYDILSDKAGFRLGGVEKGQDGYYVRADRQALRRHLWQHLDVQSGKQFERYEQSPTNGEITVFFKDGSSYQGSVLVGADGANSRVRRQLLSAEKGTAVMSQYVPLWANVKLGHEQAARYKALTSALLIAAAPNVFFALGQKQAASGATSSTSAEYYWNLCFRSHAPEQDAAEIATATQEQLYDRSLMLTQDWPDFLRTLIHDHTRAEDMSTSPPKFYEFVPPRSLPDGQVTLIGDALHPMVPFRGAGANTAAKDAGDLFSLIKDTFMAQPPGDGVWSPAPSTWSDILQQYATTACPRGSEMVLSSRAAGEQNVGNAGNDPMAELAKGRLAAGEAGKA